VAQVCPSCGQENPEGFRLCGMCGASLAAAPEPPREERKVVTVLFADLVGFTSRAEQLDPEDVRGMLSPYYQQLRGELERHGGTVEKFIGDAVMAVFGAPVAHEDDPERAVRAALAIRDWISEHAEDLSARVAVNTGEALVTLGARPSEGEGMVAGDVVNTTARLQAAAPVNGILVGEATYRATRTAIEYGEHEPVAAKGKAEPVPVWHALEARSRFGTDVDQAPRTPLLGRERELDALRDALERARTEREIQLVTLVGVPGIGKSRLVSELFRVVDDDPELIVWRQGRSLPYGEGVSLWALGEMVKAQAGILESDSPDEAEAKLGRTVRDVAPEEADWVEMHLRPLVGLATGVESTGDRQGEAFTAWRAFFEGLGERGPVVLVFEDLQWADEGLLDFIDHLVDWATGVPILVVCTARPELLTRRPGWGGGKSSAVTLSLSPLSENDTARLVHALLDRAVLPVETQSAVLSRAGGNPLYAEEFARMVAERGTDGELALPESLQGMIAARLDALPAEQKALLQDAAVVGKVFWLGAVAALGDGKPRSLETDLHALERKEFIRRERRSSVGGENEYAFRHVLMRDVAYGQIPRGRRAEKHRRTAEWTESLSADRSEDRAEMLAHHYGAALDYQRASGQPVDDLVDRARIALADAGDRASTLLAFAAAAKFYGRALELWPRDGDDRPYLLFRLGQARHFAEDEGVDELTEAREGLVASGDLERAAECDVIVAEMIWRRLRREEALARLEQARALLADRPPTRAKGFVESGISRILMLENRNGEAIRIGREALAIADALDLDDLRSMTLNNVGVARANLGDLGGVSDLEKSIAIGRQINSPRDIGRGLTNLAAVRGQNGDIGEMRQLIDDALATSRRFGLGGSLVWLTAEKAIGDHIVGDWDSALAIANDFITAREQGQPQYMESAVRSIRGEILLARGDTPAALDDERRALELARAAHDPQALWPAATAAARVLLLAGARNEALSLAEECVAFWRSDAGTGFPLYDWAIRLAWVMLWLGRGTELRDLASSVRVKTRWQPAAVAVARGDLDDAAAALAEIGATTEEAFAHLYAAEAGGPPEHLERALAFYRRVGATAFVARAERLLAASA
jgi:class 3 adenylate cyclase/tetratricopeptide (TPR) repeat protein